MTYLLERAFDNPICINPHLLDFHIVNCLGQHSQLSTFSDDITGYLITGFINVAHWILHKNLIGYNRGYAVIHYTEGLKNQTCACYKTDKETYNRMLNKVNFELAAKSVTN